ncbi:hypothetical protein [Pseudomonas sp. MF4836]|uniref:hypothetical protein n=1 Tax=Pseudomonas sp. MF4836 TaxID=1960827 RepID=UPI0015B6DCEF|nr:hypothetical protein [Pseudomonas sp. MF4836]
MKKIVWMLLPLSLLGCDFHARSSAPTLWNDGIMLEQKKVAVDEQHAKVIMQSTSVSAVEFSVRRENDPDPRPEKLGTASKPLGGKLGAWFATFESAVHKNFPQLEIPAQPGQKLQVLGYWETSGTQPAPGYEYQSTVQKVYDPQKNKWEDKPVSIPTVPTSSHCGPLGSTFVPEKQKVYLVEFARVDNDTACQQHVYDITQPNQRIPVVLIDDMPGSSMQAFHSP